MKDERKELYFYFTSGGFAGWLIIYTMIDHNIDRSSFFAPGSLVLTAICILALLALISERIKKVIVSALLVSMAVIALIGLFNSVFLFAMRNGIFDFSFIYNIISISLAILLYTEIIPRFVFNWAKENYSLWLTAFISLALFSALQKMQLRDSFNPFRPDNYIQWYFCIFWAAVFAIDAFKRHRLNGSSG